MSNQADRGVAPSVVASSQVVATVASLTRLDRVLKGAWHNRFGTAPDCFARLPPCGRAADRIICAGGAASTALKPVCHGDDAIRWAAGLGWAQ
jgi:hypothetical protein